MGKNAWKKLTNIVFFVCVCVAQMKEGLDQHEDEKHLKMIFCVCEMTPNLHFTCSLCYVFTTVV